MRTKYWRTFKDTLNDGSVKIFKVYETLSAKMIRNIKETLATQVSFNQKIDFILDVDGWANEAENCLVRDCIVDHNQKTPFDEIVQDTSLKNIEEALSTLTNRENKVIEMRFGLKDGVDYTLEETAIYCGVSRERIRQIEAKALRKLRHPSRSERLKIFWEDG